MKRGVAIHDYPFPFPGMLGGMLLGVGVAPSSYTATVFHDRFVPLTIVVLDGPRGARYIGHSFIRAKDVGSFMLVRRNRLMVALGRAVKALKLDLRRRRPKVGSAAVDAPEGNGTHPLPMTKAGRTVLQARCDRVNNTDAATLRVALLQAWASLDVAHDGRDKRVAVLEAGLREMAAWGETRGSSMHDAGHWAGAVTAKCAELLGVPAPTFPFREPVCSHQTVYDSVCQRCRADMSANARVGT